MSKAVGLSIDAYVDIVEQPMLISAANQMSVALSDEGGHALPARLTFLSFAQPASAPSPSLVIASFLSDIFPLDRPMTTIEAVWRKRLETRLKETRCPVFLCTVFRAFPNVEDRLSIIEKIRRLNLLVAELSHDFETFVLDIDRMLAFFGAAVLQTDYRLGGPLAADVAGHAVVTSLLGCDLDGIIPADLQAVGAKRHGAMRQLEAVVARRLTVKDGAGR